MRWSWIGLLGNIENKTWRKIWTFIFVVIVIGAIAFSIFQLTEYAAFASDIDEIDFTFEYPQRSWDEPAIIHSDDKYTVDIQGPFDISVTVYLENSTQAQTSPGIILDEHLKTYYDQPNIHIYSDSVLTNGDFSGPRAVIHYDAIDESMDNGGYIPFQSFIWIVPYHEKLYEISISGSREILNEKWEDQARFLQTFSILD